MRAMDLTGHQYGQLVVLKDTGKRYHRSVVWRCRCDCGEEVDVPAMYLRSGQVDGCTACRTKRRSDNWSNKPVDITGNVYGELTVIRPIGKTKHGGIVWECICSCGNITRATTSNLRSGHVKSCGHLLGTLARERALGNHNKAIDITGKRFGRLVAECPLAEKNKFGQRLWLCRCDCGNIRACPTGSLTSGATKSCGCARKIHGSDAYNITCPECGKAYRVESLEDAPPLCPECTEKLDHE